MRRWSPEDRERVLRWVAAGNRLIDQPVPPETVRTWRRTDAEFARRFAEAKAVGASAGQVAVEPLLDREEWDRLLAQACRNGSVAALRLWRDTHTEAVEPVVAVEESSDPLAELDELAGRRRAHGG